jgi:protein-disulfide isomerase
MSDVPGGQGLSALAGRARGQHAQSVGKQSRVITRQQRLVRAAAQRRQAKRNRLLAYGGGLVIVGLLVAIVVAVANAVGGPSPAGGDTPKTLVAPANATAAGAIMIGDQAAPVKVEIYLDYMCPFCGRFERANAEQLDRLVADGTIRLEVYPMSFLDKASGGTRYSTRAANAMATVADRAPDKVLAFNQALFAQQPQEGSQGLTDARIAELARGAGVPQEVIDNFAARTFEPWIAKLTETAFATGVNSTPTVKINGVVFKGDLLTAGPLAEAIAAAKGRP